MKTIKSKEYYTIRVRDCQACGDVLMDSEVIDGKEYILQAGDTLVMPAKKPHSVYAKEDFKWLLTVVFPS